MNVPKIIFPALVAACIAGGVRHFCPTSNAPVSFSEKSFVVSPENGFAPKNVFKAGTPTASAPDDSNVQENQISDSVLQLCRYAEFPTALRLAQAAPPELRGDCLKTVFISWARIKPQDAIKSLDAISDPQLRSVALHAAADGWNANDPAGLATYACALPSNADRDDVLVMAMDNWSLQDPAAFAAWLNDLPRGNELDLGTALMIFKTDGANRTPELAMQWVENMDDTTLRQDSLAHVLREWSQTDAVAAQNYVVAATWLTDSQRREIFERIFTPAEFHPTP